MQAQPFLHGWKKRWRKLAFVDDKEAASGAVGKKPRGILQGLRQAERIIQGHVIPPDLRNQRGFADLPMAENGTEETG